MHILCFLKLQKCNTGRPILYFTVILKNNKILEKKNYITKLKNYIQTILL